MSYFSEENYSLLFENTGKDQFEEIVMVEKDDRFEIRDINHIKIAGNKNERSASVFANSATEILLLSEEIVVVDKPEEPSIDSGAEDWINISTPSQKFTEKIDQIKVVQNRLFDDEAELSRDVLDVEFIFGLITLSEQPDISKYLRAAECIIGEDAKGSAQIQSATYQSEKQGVNCYKISATLSVINENENYQESKRRVLGALKEAVTNGSFKAKAFAISLDFSSETTVLSERIGGEI